jgi:hypothetical protein
MDTWKFTENHSIVEKKNEKFSMKITLILIRKSPLPVFSKINDRMKKQDLVSQLAI